MLDGRLLNGMPSFRRALTGIGFVPQEREIFPSLSVRENLDVAARPGHWTRERVFALFPRLKERLDNMGNQLSGGEQQMLSIARALLDQSDSWPGCCAMERMGKHAVKRIATAANIGRLAD